MFHFQTWIRLGKRFGFGSQTWPDPIPTRARLELNSGHVGWPKPDLNLFFKKIFIKKIIWKNIGFRVNPNLNRLEFVLPEPTSNKNSGHMGWPEFNLNPNLPNTYPNFGSGKSSGRRVGLIWRARPNFHTEASYLYIGLHGDWSNESLFDVSFGSCLYSIVFY